MKEWINIKDRLPQHSQHVLVWENRFNVYSRCNDGLGDDGMGRVRIGDAIFRDRLNGTTPEEFIEKQNQEIRALNLERTKYSLLKEWESYDDYCRANGSSYRWEGHGPCSFKDVTHWMPLPNPPEGFVNE